MSRLVLDTNCLIQIVLSPTIITMMSWRPSLSQGWRLLDWWSLWECLVDSSNSPRLLAIRIMRLMARSSLWRPLSTILTLYILPQRHACMWGLSCWHVGQRGGWVLLKKQRFRHFGSWYITIAAWGFNITNYYLCLRIQNFRMMERREYFELPSFMEIHGNLFVNVVQFKFFLLLLACRN